MPAVLRGGVNTSLDLGALLRADIDYDYPHDLNLKPGSSLHDKIRDRVMDRAWESRNVIQKRFDSWREIDRSMTAFIPKSDAEKDVQKVDKRKPVSIVVPTSYANLQVLLTYHVAALLEEPICKYEGVGPEDVYKAILMEHYINQQARRSKLLLSLHTIASDAYKYNVGIGMIDWQIKRAPGRRVLRTLDGGLFARGPTIEEAIPGGIIFEGNVVKAIDPYLFLPDPHFEAWDIQAMESVGWVYTTNWFTLLKDEKANSESYFNVKYLEFLGDGRSHLVSSNQDARAERHGVDIKSRKTVFNKPIDVIVMLVDLIPSDWDLGDRDDVETWLFKIAADQVIIDAGPIDLEHGMKPLFGMAADYDGHSSIPPSRMEIDYPMQHAINWLYNTHITNVRKGVNNMLLVDPGLANYNDVIDTREGAVIRMRKSVWGLGRVKDAVMQLPINDVTRQNMLDITYLMELEDRVTGASGAVSGQISQKRERVSSFETRQAALSTLQRLEKDARIMYAQAYYDMSLMMAYHTIQMMSEDTWVNMAGKLPDDLATELGVDIEQNRVKIGPDLFRNFRFDVVPHDGTIPGSHSDPSSLIQFMQVLANPEVAQQFDFVRIAQSVGRRLGIKEVHSFMKRIQPTVQSDQAIAEGVASGALSPLGGDNGL